MKRKDLVLMAVAFGTILFLGINTAALAGPINPDFTLADPANIHE